MIVLEAIPAIDSGGAQLSAMETVSAIREAGGTALVASAGGRLEDAFAAAGARLIELPLATKNPLLLWRNAGKLAALIRAEKVDLVHAHSRGVAWSALFAARRTERPFVTTWHGAYGENFLLKPSYNSVMAKGDRVIAVSRFIARRILARHPEAVKRLSVIPPGVDPGRFDPDRVPDRAVAELAGRWKLPPGRPVILLPARLARWKGQAVLIEALAGLADPAPVAVFVGPLDGRGGYVAGLRELGRRLGVGDRLRFVGGTEAMPAALALADIVVNASTEPEAFGRVIIEAEAMRRPVIATAHGAAGETLIAGKTGWLVPPGDAPALAEALGRFFALPPPARAAIGRAGREFVATNFSLAAMQAATLGVFRELLVQAPEKPRQGLRP